MQTVYGSDSSVEIMLPSRTLRVLKPNTRTAQLPDEFRGNFYGLFECLSGFLLGNERVSTETLLVA